MKGEDLKGEEVCLSRSYKFRGLFILPVSSEVPALPGGNQDSNLWRLSLLLLKIHQES